MKENHSDLNQNLKLRLKNLIEVSAGLVFRDGLVLITQRRQQDHLGGLWEFPGGKRECDESDEACFCCETSSGTAQHYQHAPIRACA